MKNKRDVQLEGERGKARRIDEAPGERIEKEKEGREGGKREEGERERGK